nr:hypothetical protein [uncultured Mediterranean phage uvMED]
MDYLIYFLSTLGAAYIISVSPLLRKLRVTKKPLLRYFLNCAMCLSFWIGIINATFFFTLQHHSILLGLSSSAIPYVIFLFTRDKVAERKTNKRGCCGK